MKGSLAYMGSVLSPAMVVSVLLEDRRRVVEFEKSPRIAQLDVFHIAEDVAGRLAA